MTDKKIQEIFNEGLDNIKNAGFSTFQSYLDKCATGNIFSLSYENQVLVFHQNKKASFLCSYDRWKEYGQVPIQEAADAGKF